MQRNISSFYPILLAALFSSGCVCVIPVIKASPVTKGTTAQVIGKGKIGGAVGIENAFDATNGIDARWGENGLEIGASPVGDETRYRSFLISGDMAWGVTKSTDIEAGILYTPVFSLGGRIGVKQRLFPLGKDGAVALYPRVSYIWAYEHATVIFPNFFSPSTMVDVDEDRTYYTTSVEVPLIFTIPLARLLAVNVGPEIVFRNLRCIVEYSEKQKVSGIIQPTLSGRAAQDFFFVQPGAFIGLTAGGRRFSATFELTWLRTKDQAGNRWHDIFFPGLGLQFGGGASPPKPEEHRDLPGPV